MTKLTEAEEIHLILKKNKQLIIFVLATLILLILYMSILAYGGYMVYKSIPTIIETVNATVSKFEEAMSKISAIPQLPAPV